MEIITLEALLLIKILKKQKLIFISRTVSFSSSKGSQGLFPPARLNH